MAIIRLRDALREMDTGRVFSIRFYTGDVSRHTGGKRIDIERATLNDLTDTPHTGGESQPKSAYASVKAPRHTKNRTRNIRILPSGEVRKLHISLITQFNGQMVVY